MENLEILQEALDAGADIIMLDNMKTNTMKKAVKVVGNRVKTECSGNMTRERVAELVEVGVDYISCGALTHSAPILDISLMIL